jgi:hypothetical protein
VKLTNGSGERSAGRTERPLRCGLLTGRIRIHLARQRRTTVTRPFIPHHRPMAETVPHDIGMPI